MWTLSFLFVEFFSIHCYNFTIHWMNLEWNFGDNFDQVNLNINLTLFKQFAKQLFRIQIEKGHKVPLWNQVKFRMEVCYSELLLACRADRIYDAKMCNYWTQKSQVKCCCISFWKGFHILLCSLRSDNFLWSNAKSQITPARTLSISGLKSRVLKFLILLPLRAI